MLRENKDSGLEIVKMNWYVICTRPKWELKIYKTLLGQNIEAYCPTYNDLRQWSDRKKKLIRPYFNSYVFVRLREIDRKHVFAISGVVRFLFWQGKAATVRDEEIRFLKQYLDGASQETVKIEHFAIGQEVAFSSGAFNNLNAYIEEIGRKRVRLILPSLGYRITAHIADLVPKPLKVVL
jgi:transcription antitermination factor NusG